MKKVLVLVVLCVLLVGVMPTNAEGEVNPAIPNLDEEIFDLLLTSREFQVGHIRSIDAETRQLTIKHCIYSNQSPCLTLYVTDLTIIRIFGKQGLGNFDDLTENQGVVIEYFLQDGVAYASRLLASEKFLFFTGTIREVDLEKRTISACFRVVFYSICMKNGIVPNFAIITFEWDQKHHELDDLFIGDEVRYLYYPIDETDEWVVPILHVLINQNREQFNEIPTQNHMMYAPLIVHKR